MNGAGPDRGALLHSTTLDPEAAGLNEMTRLLVVEDEVKLGEALAEGLTRAQYTVDLALDGEVALDFARSTPYDVIVLDVMLPKVDGFEVCRRLRAEGTWIPILMLTARDAVQDRIAGLDAGADDYLVKPFAFGELLARVRALLRREASHREGVLRVAELTLEPAAQRIQWAGRPIDMTAREYRVLEALMRRPGWIVSREALIESVWGFDFADTSDTSNLVEVYVGRVRRKLTDAGAPALIQTIRGAGYRLREPDP
jgi:two-component system OmpR family response regulator